nr:hypothetical protein [Saccharopolyspora spinosa]
MAAQIEVEGRRIELSNPAKVLYPDDGYRKHDVVEYFRSVAAVMVAHTRGKPLTLRRFPDGIGSGGFFQKEASNHFPEWVRVASVPQRGGQGVVHHAVVDDAATLLYLANLACLEFHVGLSTVDDLDRPILAVLDLDPPEGADLAGLRYVVRLVCERFRVPGCRRTCRQPAARDSTSPPRCAANGDSTRLGRPSGSSPRQWRAVSRTGSPSNSARTSVATGSSWTPTATPTARR